jgi:hypothetical protein
LAFHWLGLQTPGTDANIDLFDAISAETWHASCRALAAAHSVGSGAETFVYLFTHDSPVITSTYIIDMKQAFSMLRFSEKHNQVVDKFLGIYHIDIFIGLLMNQINRSIPLVNNVSLRSIAWCACGQARRGIMGAAHALEMPFVFGTFSTLSRLSTEMILSCILHRLFYVT